MHKMFKISYGPSNSCLGSVKLSALAHPALLNMCSAMTDEELDEVLDKALFAGGGTLR